MSLRIKRHWFREAGERSAHATATAVAATVWRASVHGVQGVRKAKFAVEVGAPFIDALTEFLAFLVVVADRIAYRQAPAWREEFTVGLVRRLADIYAENLDHLVGPDGESGYQPRFIQLINARMSEYAEFDYDEQGPDFGFLRYFGSRIVEAMSDADDQRWVLDQIMSAQAPEAVELVERALRGLLGIDAKPRRAALAGAD